TCILPTAISVEVGQSYSIRSTGSVALMKLDYSQQLLFPNVGTVNGEKRVFQPKPANGTNTQDVPSLWAGPTSAYFQ
ncbi:MAG: hypothetical protein K2P84_04185, partial [Undibacterium sp.]|nr:hypothetical protein [Undibacterium sp.]